MNYIGIRTKSILSIYFYDYSVNQNMKHNLRAKPEVAVEI